VGVTVACGMVSRGAQGEGLKSEVGAVKVMKEENGFWFPRDGRGRSV